MKLFSQGDALRVRIGLGPPGLPGDTVCHIAGTRPGGPGRARTRIVKDTNFPYKFEFTKYFISFQLLDGRLSVQLGVQDPLHHQRGAQLCLPGVDRPGAAFQAERRRRGGTLCFQLGPLRCGQDGKGNWWVSLEEKRVNFQTLNGLLFLSIAVLVPLFGLHNLLAAFKPDDQDSSIRIAIEIASAVTISYQVCSIPIRNLKVFFKKNQKFISID